MLNTVLRAEGPYATVKSFFLFPSLSGFSFNRNEDTRSKEMQKDVVRKEADEMGEGVI
jgi:hypothetical protein